MKATACRRRWRSDLVDCCLPDLAQAAVEATCCPPGAVRCCCCDGRRRLGRTRRRRRGWRSRRASLRRHDESRIKCIAVGERPSTAVRAVNEHAAGVGVRLVEERITENTAVNPSNLIECFFNAIPRRLGKVHWVIGRRHYRIEAFLVWRDVHRGLECRQPTGCLRLDCSQRANCERHLARHSEQCRWYPRESLVDHRQQDRREIPAQIGAGLEILQTRRRGLRLSHSRKEQ